MRTRASGKMFSVGLKFGGKWYSVFAARRYPLKSEAEESANMLRRQGYSARVAPRAGFYLVYFRERKKERR